MEGLDIFELAILMLEPTPLSIGAILLLVECRACLGLVLLVVDRRGFPHELILSVSELALGPIATEANFDPILAHLCLILGLIDFFLLLRVTGRQ